MKIKIHEITHIANIKPRIINNDEDEARLMLADTMMDYLDEAIAVLKKDKTNRPLVLKLRDVENYIRIGG